jgi:hypothetical protein
MSAKYSRLLAGIIETASQGARQKLRMGSFCHNVAQFDTPNNKLNSTILVAKSGTRGSFISKGAGNTRSLSGGYSAAPLQTPQLQPVFVESLRDFLSAVSFGGPATTGMSVGQLKAMAKSAVELSKIQIGDYLNRPGGPVLGKEATPAYEETLKFLDGVQGLDPRADAFAQSIYRIATGNSSGSGGSLSGSSGNSNSQPNSPTSPCGGQVNGGFGFAMK